MIAHRLPALPGWTLLIAVLALITHAFPQLGSFLIYDRAAIVQGEIWRLLTGSLVHFSVAHLAYNLTAWLIVGTIIELQQYRFFPALCFLSALFIGMTIFIFEPDMIFYAGLSGMVSAAVTYLCLHGIGEKGLWRWLCIAALAGLLAKTIIELASGSSFMMLMNEENFVSVPLSHLAGIVAAMLLFLLLRVATILQQPTK